MCTKTSTEIDETTTTTTSLSRYPITEYTTTTDYEPGMVTTYTTTIGNKTETITLTVPCYSGKVYITSTETTTVHDTSPGIVVAISLCSALFGLLLAAAAFACFLSRRPKKKSPPSTPVPAPYTPTPAPATYGA
jgi:hypothetical protein